MQKSISTRASKYLCGPQEMTRAVQSCRGDRSSGGAGAGAAGRGPRDGGKRGGDGGDSGACARAHVRGRGDLNERGNRWPAASQSRADSDLRAHVAELRDARPDGTPDREADQPQQLQHADLGHDGEPGRVSGCARRGARERAAQAGGDLRCEGEGEAPWNPAAFPGSLNLTVLRPNRFLSRLE